MTDLPLSPHAAETAALEGQVAAAEQAIRALTGLRDLAERERDEARSALAQIQAARDATLEQEVTAILDAMSVVEVGHGAARVSDTLIPALSKMMALLLFKSDGTLWNYLEWSIGSDPDIGELRLIMQRVEGKTIADLYREMRDERDRARADCTRLWTALGVLVDATTSYFNKRGAGHAMRPDNEDIAALADALAQAGPVFDGIATAEQAVLAALEDV